MIVYKKEHLIIKSSKDHQKIQQLGAIYVHEVQSWALRPHCIKTGLIVSWKSLHELRNRAIQKFILHLYHMKKMLCVNMIQKQWHLLWAKVHLEYTEMKWETVLWSNLKFLLVIMDTGTARLKRRGSIQLIFSNQFKILHFWWYDTMRYDTIRYGTVRYGTVRYGTIRYDTMGEEHPERQHQCRKTYTGFRATNAPIQRLFSERLWMLQQDNAIPHIAATTAWLSFSKSAELSACSPDL